MTPQTAIVFIDSNGAVVGSNLLHVQQPSADSAQVIPLPAAAQLDLVPTDQPAATD